MVTVAFDPTLIPKPKSDDDKEKEQPAAKPGQPLEVPANPFAPDPNEPKYLAEQKKAWYYVTPGDSFRSINLDRAALVKPKKAESANPPGGGTPSFSGGSPSFPNSLPPIQP